MSRTPFTSDMREAGRPRFIGCGCDAAFVEHTAVMLSSVEANGCVPDAEILVAGFDLTAEHRAILRAGAGAAAARLRVVDVTAGDLAAVGGARFTSQYPPAVLGRLFLADAIEAPGARLLTLDSDMIVNASLEPVFELDLAGEFFAAIHDPPRVDDPNYFNTGMLLFDVAMYKHHDIARRCLSWLAVNPDAHFPDQDALNAVVGHCWHRLDRLWNHFCFDDSGFHEIDYERSRIAHFAGPKPWNHADHPGRGLYGRHLRDVRRKRDQAETRRGLANRVWAATCHEVLLGRELDLNAAAERWDRVPVQDVLREVLGGREYRTRVRRPLSQGRGLGAPFRGRPTAQHRVWVADRLGLDAATARRAEAATSWEDLHMALLEDEAFMASLGLAPLRRTPGRTRASVVALARRLPLVESLGQVSASRVRAVPHRVGA